MVVKSHFICSVQINVGSFALEGIAQVYQTYSCTALDFGQKVDEKLKQISIKVFPTLLLGILSLEGECTQNHPQNLALSCVFLCFHSTGVGIFLIKTDEISPFISLVLDIFPSHNFSETLTQPFSSPNWKPILLLCDHQPRLTFPPPICSAVTSSWHTRSSSPPPCPTTYRLLMKFPETM